MKGNGMIDSIEQLRNEIQILKGNNIDTDKLTTIAESIEREVKDRYIELPKDADGEYIHIGDMIIGDMIKYGKVHRIEIADDGDHKVYVAKKPDDSYLTWRLCRSVHHKPPTVEDVLRIFADHVYNDSMQFRQVSDDTIAEYAAKLQLKEEK